MRSVQITRENIDFLSYAKYTVTILWTFIESPQSVVKAVAAPIHGAKCFSNY